MVEPVFIERIEDRDGRVLMDYHLQKHQVMEAQTARTMVHLMQGVVERGTATRVRVLGRPMAGKTGTTNKTRDAWFIGYTPSLITGTWVGMDDEHSLGAKETGSQAAAPIFISYMKEALKGQAVEVFPETPDTVLAKKDAEDPAVDDEAADGDDSFYPEEDNGALQEKRPDRPQASSQQFFKEDLEE
jgi:penicillin-binding protein 1A